MESGEWRMENGEWRMENGEWRMENENRMRKNVIKDKSFAFAIQIVNAYKLLVDNKREYIMSKQLLRSEIAIGALYSEAEHAESKKDFIHKLSIAQKECNEVLYWLDLLFATNYSDKEEYMKLNEMATSLIRLLTSIIKTTKRTINN